MWPADYIELKQIEDLLVCGICYEYMDTSVMTPCSHNYCSLCIRKYLHYKTQCPACFEETFEKDLRVNKLVDGIISCYTQIREKLLKCVRKERGCTLGNIKFNVECSPSTKSPAVKQFLRNEESRIVDDREISSKLASPSTRNLASPSTTKIASPRVSRTIDKDACSPSSSSSSKTSSFFTPKSKKQQPVVNCPVCKVDVPEANINRHLDDCLKRGTSGSKQPPKNKEKRKPLSKLVFHLMKDAELRRKLKEFGLQTQGDRKCLETRLQRYITLYNAECDKPNPRPISNLVKQCEEDENLEHKIQKTSSITHKLFVNRNIPENVIDQERKRYLQVHKSSFEQLIARAKAANCSKETTIERSPLRRNGGGFDDINVPSKRQLLNDQRFAVNSDSENGVRSTNHVTQEFQNNIPRCISDSDSDSDVPCPLQTYSSDDPLRMQRIEAMNSTNDKDDELERTISPILSDPNKTESSSFSRVKLEGYDKNTNIANSRDFAALKEDTTITNTPKRGEDSLLDEVSESDSEDGTWAHNRYVRPADLNFSHVNELTPTKNSDQQNITVPPDCASKKYRHDNYEERLAFPERSDRETSAEVDEHYHSPSAISRFKLEKENLLQSNKNEISSPARKRSYDLPNDGQARKRRNVRRSNKSCVPESKNGNNKIMIDETLYEDNDVSHSGSEKSGSVLSCTENASSRRVTRSRRRLN